MNIFATFPCPVKSAKYLDNKRVIKMILESAQLMSTAINLRGGQGPYRTTHANHPCSKWVRSNHKNYTWLFQHFKALCEEYRNRYGKVHRSEMYKHIFARGTMLMPICDKMSNFENCTLFKRDEVFKAYRKALLVKWISDKRTPTWEINNINREVK